LWALVVHYQIIPFSPSRRDYRNIIFEWVSKKLNKKVSFNSFNTAQIFYDICKAIYPEVVPPKKEINNNFIPSLVDLMEKHFNVPNGLIDDGKDFIRNPSEPPILMVLTYLIRTRIDLYREERKKILMGLTSEQFCSLSTLPEEFVLHLVKIVSDPLPWLFSNC